MWFLGLLFGTIIGAIAGGGGGALLGAIAGVLIGWALSTRSGSSVEPGDERLKAIDASHPCLQVKRNSGAGEPQVCQPRPRFLSHT